MSDKSALEEALDFQLRACGVRGYVREYVFAAPRRYRLDFAWPELKLGAEAQGGIFMGKSRHNTGAGLQDSYEKLNLACELGWFVLQYDGSAIRRGEAVQQIERVLAILGAGPQGS